MLKFVTRIVPKIGPKKAKSQNIGREIEKLSKSMGKFPKGSINKSSDINKKWKNWKGDSLNSAEEIISSLCFDVDDSSTNYVLGPVDKKDVGDIDKVINVKFVFEDEGELIIVIPHITAIETGLHDAPLNHNPVYNSFIRKEILDEARLDFEAELHKRKIDPKTIKEVLKAYDAVAKNGPGIGPKNAFYTQLGEYSCRQCGH